jgi:hypothetical protein
VIARIITSTALQGYRREDEANPHPWGTTAWELWRRQYIIGCHRRKVEQSIETEERGEAVGS